MKSKAYHIIASKNYVVLNYKIVKTKFFSNIYFKRFCKKYPGSFVQIEKYTIINKHSTDILNSEIIKTRN